MASITDKLDRVTDSTTNRPVIAKLAGSKAVGASSITLTVATNWTTTTKIHFAIYNVNSLGVKDLTSQSDWVGTLAGTTISNLTLTGGTDQAYTTAAYVELTPTEAYAKDLYDWGIKEHDVTGSHTVAAATTIAGLLPASSIGGAALASYRVIRQNDTTNTTETAAKILTGWGQGTILSGANTLAETVSFGATFTNPPIVVVSPGGDNASATTYGSGINSQEALWTAKAHTVTTTSFIAQIGTARGNNLTSNTVVFYQWIAIGV